MRRKIPSLSALESFEAVSRLGSTTRAANELGRTQSAVSRQVLNLEAFAGRPLFGRNSNRLSLNPAGQYLFEAIGRALDRLEHAVRHASALADDDRSIALRVWPTFGARWMMSRLADLPEANIDVTVELSIGIEAGTDPRSSNVDALILYGSGDWPELSAYFLVPEMLIAVVSPLAYERLGNDVSAYPWLAMGPRPDAWRRWIEARAEPGTAIKAAPSYQVSLLIEFACLGQGAAVLPSLYVERELAAGVLIAPFGEALPTGRGYYLCYAAEDAGRPKFVAFKDWLLSTC